MADQQQRQQQQYYPDFTNFTRHTPRSLSNYSHSDSSTDLEKDERDLPTQNTNKEAQDPYLVSWDGPRDPANPKNWTILRRCGITSLWVLGNFVACIASSIFASGSYQIMEEFGATAFEVNLGNSLFVLGYAVGPPIWGPISERFGRKWPETIGLFVFTLFCLPTALGNNIETLLVGRFLSGCFGAAPLSIIGGAVSDIWEPIPRGVALNMCIGSIFGTPTVAPVIGNFVTDSYLGWRWNGWLCVIMGAAGSLITLIFLPETSAAILLKRKAASMRQSTGNEGYHSIYCNETKGFKVLVHDYLLRPYALLLSEPILVFITLYQAFIYGILYLTFTVFPIEFYEIRGWSWGISSLPYLSVFVGVVLGAVLVVIFSVTIHARQTHANNGIVIPEHRLPPMMLGSLLIPIGFFIFAWTSMPYVTWVGMVIGLGTLGMGMYMVFVQGFNYIIDVYLHNANSAIGGNSFIRAFFGFGFPLFGPAMFEKLGVQWSGSLLGFISIAMIPIPFVLYIYGKTIRGWSKNGQNKN